MTESAGVRAGPSLLDEFRERREAIAAGQHQLRRRVAAQHLAAVQAWAASAAIRDAAASTRAEHRVHLEDARARSGRGASAAPTDRGPIRVLVVDDLAAMRRLLVRQLTRAGYAVVGEAATAADAVALAGALAPDVVLLDFHLPDGLGTDVAARLATMGRPPGVVFCTGDVGAVLAAGVGRAETPLGGYAVLEKPASAVVLDRVLREAVTSRGRHRLA